MPELALTRSARPNKYGVVTIKDAAGEHVRDVRVSGEQLERFRRDRGFFAQVAGFAMETDYFCADVVVTGQNARAFRMNAAQVADMLAMEKPLPSGVTKEEFYGFERDGVPVKQAAICTIRSRCSARGFAIDVGEYEIVEHTEGPRLHVCYDAGVEQNYVRPKFLWVYSDEWDGNEVSPSVHDGVLAKVEWPSATIVTRIREGLMEVGNGRSN